MASENRTVKVSLVAEMSNYVAGMEKAAKKTRELGTEAEKLAQKKEAFSALGTSLLAVGAVAATSVALAVKSYADFDQAISNVKAATQETTANMTKLREAALDAGSSTVFTAVEAANAIEELGKAGLTTEQILSGGLNGALSLAAAGQLEVADAASIAAIAVKQFGLAGSDVPHVADLLAAGAGKAVGDVTDLAAALGQAGLVANSTGLSIEETTGVLAAFADEGLLGSDAGTSLKTMLQSLVPSSTQAKKEMDRLGISAYDASGNFVGAAKFAGILQTGLSGLTQEQQETTKKIIFGSDAVRAANVFYDNGAAGIQKYIDQTNDSGYAAQVAADRLDNLKGDVEKLGGAFDTALIRSGSGANDTLRNLTQSATGFVDGIGNIPAPLLAVELGVAGVVAGVALLGGGFLTVVPKIAATKLAMRDLNITASSLGKGLGKAGVLGAGLAAVTGAFNSYGTSVSLAADQTARLDSIASTGNLSALSTEFANANAEVIDFGKALNQEFTGDFWQSDAISGPLNGAIKGISFGMIDLGAYSDTNKAKFKELGAQLSELASTDLPSANAQFQQYVNLAGGGEEATRQLLLAFPDYKAALIGIATEQGKSLTDQELINFAMGEGAQATALMTGAISAATTGSEEYKAATEAATAAQEAWTQAISESDAAFVDIDGAYSLVIQKNTEVAQSNADASKSSSDSWEDFYDGQAVSISDYLAELQSQVEAQEQWETNMVRLAGRVSDGVLTELANLGPDGAPLVADLVNASDEELARLEDVYGQRAADATGTFASTLENAGPLMSAVAAKLGEDTAAEIAEELANGTTTVEKVLAKYSIIIEGYQPSINVETAKARAKVLELVADIRSIRSEMSDLNDSDSGSGRMGTYATGGAIAGPGSGTSDDVPAMLSNGEHVLTSSDVQKAGGQAAVYRLRDQIQSGRAKFALGGAVEYRSDLRRGSVEGLSAVDRLYQLADEEKYSKAQRRKWDSIAEASEKSLLRLNKASEAASSKLDDLKSSSAQMAGRVSDSLGSVSLGAYSSTAGVKGGLKTQATRVAAFAASLKKLAARGINGVLLSEIAALGTVEGAPLAESLAKATQSDINQINASYASIQKSATAAGQTVADANYKVMIEAADKNAASLEKQIAAESAKLQKVIGRGLKLPGYATGGAISGPGARGRDSVLAMMAPGEHVLTTDDVDAMGGHGSVYRFRHQLHAGVRGYASGGYVAGPTYVPAPAANVRGSVVNNNTYNLPPMPVDDPMVSATIIGRQLARLGAGGV